MTCTEMLSPHTKCKCGRSHSSFQLSEIGIIVGGRTPARRLFPNGTAVSGAGALGAAALSPSELSAGINAVATPLSQHAVYRSGPTSPQINGMIVSSVQHIIVGFVPSLQSVVRQC
jgi:hypothetical protein